MMSPQQFMYTFYKDSLVDELKVIKMTQVIDLQNQQLVTEMPIFFAEPYVWSVRQICLNVARKRLLQLRCLSKAIPVIFHFFETSQCNR
jgi:hypothetical protein